MKWTKDQEGTLWQASVLVDEKQLPPEFIQFVDRVICKEVTLMKHRPPLSFALLLIGTIFAASTLIPAPTFAVHLDDGDPLCHGLPDYDELTQSLRDIVAVGDPSVNSGLAPYVGDYGQSPRRRLRSHELKR